MSDYLSNLIARTTESVPVVKARPLSLFEPAAMALPSLPFSDVPSVSEQPSSLRSHDMEHTDKIAEAPTQNAPSTPKLNLDDTPPIQQELAEQTSIPEKLIQPKTDSLSSKLAAFPPNPPPVTENIKDNQGQLLKRTQASSRIKPPKFEEVVQLETSNKALDQPPERSSQPDITTESAIDKAIIEPQKIVVPIVEERLLEKVVTRETSVFYPQKLQEQTVSTNQDPPVSPVETPFGQQPLPNSIPPKPDMPIPSIITTRKNIPTDFEHVEERPFSTTPQSSEKADIQTIAPPSIPTMQAGHKQTQPAIMTNLPMPTFIQNTVSLNQSDGEPEPTIQVHIGRIEVRAAPPPVEPNQTKRSEPPIMNLDDYLAQRNRGGNTG